MKGNQRNANDDDLNYDPCNLCAKWTLKSVTQKYEPGVFICLCHWYNVPNTNRGQCCASILDPFCSVAKRNV